MKFFKIIKKPDPEKEKEKCEEIRKEEIGRKDKFAMVVSAFLTLVLPASLILTGICLLVLWMFGAI